LAWSVQIDQEEAGHPHLVVRNLKALYRNRAGLETVTTALPNRKNGSEPVEFDGSLKKLAMVAVDQNMRTAVVEITTSNGTAAEQLVAIPLASGEGRQASVLVGLIGEVDAGWKLFPLHTIKTIEPAAKP
jgi:hypothetical protein